MLEPILQNIHPLLQLPKKVTLSCHVSAFPRIPSERVLAEKLAGSMDYRRICGFRRETPSRGCFTYFRRNRLKEERFEELSISWLVKPYQHTTRGIGMENPWRLTPSSKFQARKGLLMPTIRGYVSNASSRS